MLKAVNDFVIKFANVNGTGSSSANNMFARAIYRMGIPVSPRNIFPSNIQGLPTWYEVRVSDDGYIGRRGGVDIMVAMNPETMEQDIASLESGGYLLYDSSKPLAKSLRRPDITLIGIPFTEICIREYSGARLRQLFKNIVYVGSLSALLDMDFDALTTLVSEQFRGKEKLIKPNIHALELGRDYAREHFDCPLPIRVKRSDKVGDRIMIEGNAAAALGCVYAGATVAAWYPITPSTSLVDAFSKYCEKLRIDNNDGRKNFAIVQAEDELSAIGMVIGAMWNGARAFTATSGPGISLMSEFIGLAYFAEVPVVLFNIQRGGPSTGMPTRTQQSDLLACAYASHGDTKHVLLIPGNPKECFDMAVQAFDLAERLQTPVIVMSDLDVGMNDWLSEPFSWDDRKVYDRGKVLDAGALDKMADFGRYLDVDGDGVCYRTYPGVHPDKGSFFTRGTSHDAYARYTEEGEAYRENVERLLRKYETARSIMPEPIIRRSNQATKRGVIFIGTTDPAMREALDVLALRNIHLHAMRILAFPFTRSVFDFIAECDCVLVVEQNRDAQLRSLLINEGDIDPHKLLSVLNYDGTPIRARFIADAIAKLLGEQNGVDTTIAHSGMESLNTDAQQKS